jgi:hypothetical protein
VGSLNPAERLARMLRYAAEALDLVTKDVTAAYISRPGQ